jgi:multidrug efflux pump subunit AcrA (membrane-fusion protein)
MNKYLFLTTAIILIGIAVACTYNPSERTATNKKEIAVEEIDAPQIEYFSVTTEMIDDHIRLSGRLRAEHRVQLFSEVQGVVLGYTKPFREGIPFQKGEILLRLDDSEANFHVQSLRSSFKKRVSSLMADIHLDYPDAAPAYQEWFASLNTDKSLPAIPDFGERTHRFLESKGIFEFYYQIKSAEVRLEKFTIRAPFSGILSAANAEVGQVVSPQFHLGTFIDPSNYILTASVNKARTAGLEEGIAVSVMNEGEGGANVRSAMVSRIHPGIDPASQQVEVYVNVTGEGLRDGMFLEAEIDHKEPIEMARVPKTALLRTGSVLVKRDGRIEEIVVNIREIGRDMIWVKGLKNGDEIVADVSEPVAGRIIN